MTKKIFTYSLAVAAMLASCNDDFQNIESGVESGSKGKLVEAGLLGVNSVVTEGTRAFNPVGGFVWMPEALEATGELTAERLNQKVGLCWTGVNTTNPQYGAASSVGENVFTNYEYEHVGWMDMTAAELDFYECDGTISNGAFIKGEAPAGCMEADFAGTYMTGGRWNKYYYAAKQGQRSGSEALNLGSGIFKTNNASVFEGQYVVYFPYTDKFTKGAIIANTPDVFDVNHDIDLYDAASKHAFQLGYINHYEGGNRSTNFQTKNYTNFLRIAEKADLLDAGDVKTVIIYSPEKGIVYEQGVDASSVIAARRADDMSLVKQVGEGVQTNAVFANLSEGANEYANIADGEDFVILPMIPQEFDNLAVILINKDGKSQYHTFNDVKFEAGKGLTLTVNAGNTAWKDIYYAVDEPTFAFALNKINNAAAPDAEIRILRGIDMEAVNDADYATAGQISVAKNITITADPTCASAGFIIKSETTRTIEATVATGASLKVMVPVVIEGAGCCWNTAATLNVGGTDATGVEKVAFTKDVTNYGTLNVGGTKSEVAVEFEDVQNIWDTEYQMGKGYSKGSIARGKTTDAAKFNIVANLSAKVQTVTINGTLKNEGSVAVTSNKALATANAEGTRSLNVNIADVENTGVLAKGKTKAETDADIIGGDIEVSKNALVRVANSIKNTNIWAYVHVDGEGNSDENDGRIDIKGAQNSSNKGTIENDGVINLLGGSLDNTAGLFIDNLTGQVGGIPVDNGSAPADYVTYFYKGIEGANDYMTDLKSGIFVAKTATNDRMAFIINDAVESKSVVVIEVVGVEATPGYYNFSMPIYKGKDLRNYDVRINAGTEIPFIAAETNTAGEYIATKSVGHCLDIYSDLKLGSSNALNVEKNVFVREGNTLNVTANIAEFNIGKDLTVEATATVNTVLKTANTVSELNVMNVKNDIKNYGDINSKRNFTVGRDFRIYKTGNLDSDGIANGTPNEVTRDFVLAGKAAFARYTTTIVKGTFTSGSESQFVREGLGSSDVYRATVNVGTLGTTAGSATGGWPTQM